MEHATDVSVQVSGGGSGTGIAALANGTTDIAAASRPITEREIEQLRETRGEPRSVRAAIDAVAVYVNEANPIESLSIPQVRSIFRGQHERWNEISTFDEPFVLYSRENNSGTYAFFKEHVLDRLDFAAEAQSLPGTAAVIHAVSLDEGGIGYGGIGYGSGVKAIAIAADGEQAVLPTAEAAVAGEYPLARYLLLVIVGDPDPATRAFLDHVLSREGQDVVEAAGFFPLPDSVLEEER